MKTIGLFVLGTLAAMAPAAGQQGEDRRAKIDVDSYTIDVQINPDTQTLTARAAVRFVDAAGKVLGTYPTWVREDSDADQSPGADRTGLVQLVVPVERAAAALELVLDGKVVTRRSIQSMRQW